MNERHQELAAGRPRFALGVSDFSTSEPLLNAERIIACGMDFIEPGLAKIATMPQQNFEDEVGRLRSKSIRVQSVNWFLPGELKVTGPRVDDASSLRFLECALARAAQLGASAVVFGSPNSRTLPDGFSAVTGREQMISFCRLCSDVIREHGWEIKIAVEHVNHTETNFVNTFAQALSIVREVDRHEIGLAADFYHFAIEREPLEIMLDAADLICAVQLANPEGRCFPKPGAEIGMLDQFFQNLADINYRGGVSVEANVGENLESDCRGAVERLNSILV